MVADPFGSRSLETSVPSTMMAADAASVVSHFTSTGTWPLWQWTSDFIFNWLMVGTVAGCVGDGEVSAELDPEEQAASRIAAAPVMRSLRTPVSLLLGGVDAVSGGRGVAGGLAWAAAVRPRYSRSSPVQPFVTYGRDTPNQMYTRRTNG